MVSFDLGLLHSKNLAIAIHNRPSPATIVSVTDFKTAKERARLARIDRAIMARAAHLKTVP